MTTPHYGMFLSTDDDQMNDVNQSLNNAWGLIEGIPVVTNLASLPITDFSYSVGDKVYHTGLQSIFVLVASNAAWGNFWQPIQAKYGPWIQPGNSVLTNLSTYKFGTTPLQYRLTNTGKCILRGSVDTVAATGYTDFESAIAAVALQPLPPAIAPSTKSYFSGSAYPQTSGSTKPILGQLSVSSVGVFTNGVWNPQNNATGLFYDDWEWVMGYGRGYGPNN
jgi:hypothetical protein